MGRVASAASAAFVVAVAAVLLALGVPASPGAAAATVDLPATEVLIGLSRDTVVDGETITAVGHVGAPSVLAPAAGVPVELVEVWRGEPTLKDTQVSDANGRVVSRVLVRPGASYHFRTPTATSSSISTSLRNTSIARAVQRFTVRPGNGKVRVWWQTTPELGPTAPTGYAVEVLDGETVVASSLAGPTDRAADVTGLPNDQTLRVQVVPLNAFGRGSIRERQPVNPRQDADEARDPTGGTLLCGDLPARARLTAAESPYVLCPVGARVPEGGSLLLDATDGPVTVLGPGSLYAEDAEVRSVGTTAARRVTLGAPGRPVRVYIQDIPHESFHFYSGGTLRLAHVDIVGGPMLSSGHGAVLEDVTVTAEAEVGAVYSPQFDPRDWGVFARRMSVRLSAVRVTGNVAQGIDLGGCPTCSLDVQDSAVTGARQVAMSLSTDGPVTAQRLVVADSGTGEPGATPARRYPAYVVNGRLSLGVGGIGGSVAELTSSGPSQPVVHLGGQLVQSSTWVSPPAVDGPVGYVVGGLSVPAGVELTVPAGSHVAGGGSLVASGGTIDVAAGSLLTSTEDPAALVNLCRTATCTSSLWGGLHGTDSSVVEVRGSTVRLASSVQQFVPFDGTMPAAGRFLLTDVSIEGAQAGFSSSTRSGGRAELRRVQVDARLPSGHLGTGVFVSADHTVLEDVAVRNARTGVDLLGRGSVTVDRLLVEDIADPHHSTPGYALQVRGAQQIHLRDVTVRRTDRRAVRLFDVRGSLGPGRDIDGITGSGNGRDSVTLHRTRLTGASTWENVALPGAAEPALALDGQDLVVGDGGELDTLTVPAGVAPELHGGMTLSGAELRLEPGSRLGASSVSCSATFCLPPLSIGMTPDATGRRSLVTGDQVTFDVRSVATPQWPYDTLPRAGDLRLTRSSLPSGLQAHRLGTVRLLDSRSAAAVSVDALDAVEVSRNVVSRDLVTPAGQDQGIRVAARDGAELPVRLQDNTVRGFRQAIRVFSGSVVQGADADIRGNRGGGNELDAVVLTGTNVRGRLTWSPVTQSAEDHDLGFILDGVSAVDGAVVTVPRGATVKGSLRLVGSTLDATAGGAVMASLGDASVQPGVGCPGLFITESCRRPPVAYDAAGTGMGGIHLVDATYQGDLVATGTGELATAPGRTVQLTDVTVLQGTVQWWTQTVRLTDTTSALHRTVVRMGDQVGWAKVEAVGGSIDLEDVEAGGISTLRTALRLRGVTAPWATLLSAPAAAQASCLELGSLSVRDDSQRATSYDLSIVDSSLPGTLHAFDGQVQTRGVWWGQPGGPRPGQADGVQDEQPAEEIPPCAGAFGQPPKPNRAPVTGDDAATTTEGTVVYIDVLGNDTDPDGDHLHLASARVDSTSGSSVEIEGSRLVYRPAAGFRGEDALVYTAEDRRGGVSQGRVQVTVTAIDPGPTDPGPTDPASPPQAPSGPAARSIDDACPSARVPGNPFADVPTGSTHERAISCLVWWQVAKGRTPTNYAPTAGVTRDAMAAFVARTILKAKPGSLNDNPPDAFGDDNGSIHQKEINQLAAAGIVSGTGGGSYSPSAGVTRGQMARFLANAVKHVTGSALPIERDLFSDDNTSLFQDDINRVAQAGLTGGRADGTYGPTGPVVRDQMGSFLARTLDLFVDSGAKPPP